MIRIDFIHSKIYLIAAFLFCFVLSSPAIRANDSPNSPNDIRSLFPLNDSEWNSLKSVVGVERLPKEQLALMLYRLRQRHVENSLHEQIVSFENVAELAQGSVVERTENVLVRKITLQKSGVQHIEPKFKSFYVCDLSVAGLGNTTCVTLRIPQVWLDSVSPDEDGSIRFDPPKHTGFLGILVTPGPEPVFVAPRLQDRSDSLLSRCRKKIMASE